MTRHTTAGPPARSRTRRRRALAALGAGLPLILTACGGEGGDGTGTGPGSGGGDTNAGPVETELFPPDTVCDLIDVASLQSALGSTSYSQNPTDVPAGYGIDPGGPQCAAQFAIPDSLSSSAMLNAAVVPYPSIDDATTGFDDRVGKTGSESGGAVRDTQPLDGPWDQATVITVSGGSRDMSYALAQRDNILLKVQVTAPGEAFFDNGAPFTLDQVTAEVTGMLTDLDTAVMAFNEG